jgi:hypothetical protein
VLLGYSEAQHEAAQAASELIEVRTMTATKRKTENGIPTSVHKTAAGLHKAG